MAIRTMPSMLVLKSSRVAAHWNNEATLLMQRRDYSKAAATLTKALLTLKEGLNTTTTTNAPPTSIQVSSSSYPTIRIAHTSTTFSSSRTTSSSYSSSENGEEEKDVMIETAATSSTTYLLKFLSIGKPEQESQAMLDNVSSFSSFLNTTTSSSLQQRMMAVPLDDDDIYVYHAPLQVTSSEALVSSPLCVEIVSYAIIYNLALCYHLEALLFVQEGTSSSLSLSLSLSLRTMQLQRAVSFYQHAQRLARAHSLTFCCMDILSILVLVNNMGHAHYCLDKESTMATRCFQQLWNAILDYYYPTLFMSTSSTQEYEQLLQPHWFNHSEPSGLVQCFLLNIVHFLILGLGTRVAAPAA